MDDRRPKVFGLGLSRTGTISLAGALNTLGIKTIHFPCDERTYDELKTGMYDLTILQEYQGVVDTPVVPFYPQLDAHYPGSKFILTTREKDAWLRSCEAFLPLAWNATPDGHGREYFAFIHACVYGVVPFNRERFAYVYDMHVRNVMEYFSERPEDLLIMDITAGDGWETLCPFLGARVPDAPFPHLNGSDGLADLSDWVSAIQRTTQELLDVIPPGARFLLIDDGMLGTDFASGRIVLRLPEGQGVSARELRDTPDAAQGLNAVLGDGAAFLVAAKWAGWPEDYLALEQRLRSTTRRLLDSELLVVFDLRTFE